MLHKPELSWAVLITTTFFTSHAKELCWIRNRSMFVRTRGLRLLVLMAQGRKVVREIIAMLMCKILLKLSC
jgi:hypothetical protein